MYKFSQVMRYIEQIVLMSCFCVLYSCSTPTSSNKIIVAAAASTQYVLEELIATYEKEHGIKVESIIGSSGKLTTQIEQGAPIDLFISADTLYPAYLAKKGLGVKPPVIYANGTLVLWTYGQLDLKRELSILMHPSIQKIALADPKIAPYGQLSKRCLEAANLYSKLKGKLVFGESISQVNQYITTESVDLGLTAKAIVMAPRLKGKGTYWDIPNYQLAQSMLLLKQNKQTESFYQFLLSKQASVIFEKYGYL